MTYALLLLLFVVAPTFILLVAVIVDQRRRRGADLRRSAVVTLLALLALATVYTMPWDDHLIALRVWWYQPTLLSGTFVGHMPIEELLFFPLQTLLVGLWWMWLAPRFDAPSASESGAARPFAGRVVAVGVGGALWLGALGLLLAGWRPATYLGWELTWALPPLLLQTLVGGDLLWRRRRLVGVGIISATLYLSGVDALAISQGIWTIDPRQSLDLLLGGRLPLEELVFFLVTSALVVCGLTLGVSREAQRRMAALPARVGALLGERIPAQRHVGS